jgi:ADP-dependent NAD(P)H-hydrate dehydratase / NAD(P)H-hydrate epimerase
VIPVLSSEQMRAADRHAIETLGIPGSVLMENAGGAVARALQARFPERRRVVILCGKGNNGGDGFVVASGLRERQPKVFLLARRDQLQGDAATQAAAYERSGGVILELADEEAWRRAAPLQDCDLVVDALLGTGLKQAPSGVFATAIAAMREKRRAGAIAVVAVDLPSGLSSDSGAQEWPAVEADLTVTFAAPKWGHVLPPGCDSVGELLVADIGIPDEALRQTGPGLYLLEARDAAAGFPARTPGSHKGDFGHVLVLAGSLGKTGAAVLAGTAALRAGAGLVTVATPAAALPLVAAGRPELMTEPLPSSGETLGSESLTRALELAEARDAVVLGPGLGQGREVQEFVADFVARCGRPLLIDADGLNALAATGLQGLPRHAPTLLTPHPGEMARLLGISTKEVQADRVQSARRLAEATRSVVILKGQRSLVADPGGRSAVNPTGNPGMATGGTGDVLSGIGGALLARHGDAWLAGCASVYVHGRAGDLAGRERGQDALIAGDLNEALGAAILSVQRGDEQPGIARV